MKWKQKGSGIRRRRCPLQMGGLGAERKGRVRTGGRDGATWHLSLRNQGQ